MRLTSLVVVSLLSLSLAMPIYAGDNDGYENGHRDNLPTTPAPNPDPVTVPPIVTLPPDSTTTIIPVMNVGGASMPSRKKNHNLVNVIKVGAVIAWATGLYFAVSWGNKSNVSSEVGVQIGEKSVVSFSQQ